MSEATKRVEGGMCTGVGVAGTLRIKSESGIFGIHLQKMQNSQIP
jgi:hypothetical protein